MTTDSPQRPPQGSARPLQQDRREFLKVAAAIPTALATTQALGADAPADKAKPADTTPMPQIQWYDRYSDQAGQNAALARRFGSRA